MSNKDFLCTFLVAIWDCHMCDVPSLPLQCWQREKGCTGMGDPELEAGTFSPEEPADAFYKGAPPHLCRVDGAGWECIQGGHVCVSALNSLLGSWAIMDAPDDLWTNQRAWGKKKEESEAGMSHPFVSRQSPTGSPLINCTWDTTRCQPWPGFAELKDHPNTQDLLPSPLFP